MAEHKRNESGEHHGIPGAAIAAGMLAAGTAAAAGYYFYGTKRAKQHRKDAAKWAHDFKSEVMREAKKVKAFDEKVVHGIIDRVADTFSGEGMDADSLKAAASELKDNWRKVKKELEPGGGRRVMRRMPATKKAAKKAVRGMMKRSVRKPAKKTAAKSRK